jgi:hypothetical protein
MVRTVATRDRLDSLLRHGNREIVRARVFLFSVDFNSACIARKEVVKGGEARQPVTVSGIFGRTFSADKCPTNATSVPDEFRRPQIVEVPIWTIPNTNHDGDGVCGNASLGGLRSQFSFPVQRTVSTRVWRATIKKRPRHPICLRTKLKHDRLHQRVTTSLAKSSGFGIICSRCAKLALSYDERFSMKSRANGQRTPHS